MGKRGHMGQRGQQRGQIPKNKRIGCSKAIALPTKDHATRLEPVIQGPAGSLWREQCSNRFQIPIFLLSMFTLICVQ
jgi:hypothetical protein